MSNTRTINYKKQVSYSFVYKILSVFFSFLIVRFMLQYLGIELYGVWSVLLVLISWIIFFDFGIANGIKNKVSQSLANDDILSARQYISTGYIALFIFVLVIYLLFFIINLVYNLKIDINSRIIDSRRENDNNK